MEARTGPSCADGVGGRVLERVGILRPHGRAAHGHERRARRRMCMRAKPAASVHSQFEGQEGRGSCRDAFVCDWMAQIRLMDPSRAEHRPTDLYHKVFQKNSPIATHICPGSPLLAASGRCAHISCPGTLSPPRSRPLPARALPILRAYVFACADYGHMRGGARPPDSYPRTICSDKNGGRGTARDLVTRTHG